MDIHAYIRTRMMRLATAVAVMLPLASCDSAIYDDEGDCSVTYKLRFKYDKNIKFADAFASEVKSVAVYAYDQDGLLVWQKAEKIDEQTAEDYLMTLDLPAGNYDLIAWCGLGNEGGQWPESFELGAAETGVSHIDDLTCRLNRKHAADGSAYSDQYLYPLFHGQTSVTVIDENDPAAVPGEHISTMHLTKDTNRVRVILQQMSGDDMDVSRFTFRIEDNNGWMAHTNELLADETITYHTWNTETGEAGIGQDDYPVVPRLSPSLVASALAATTASAPAATDKAPASRAITTVKAAIADLTVARLMKDHPVMLTIRNDEGGLVARIPLVDYALMIKGVYEHDMTDQDYLDRQDSYVLTFFLDQSHKWAGASIVINSWRVILNNVDIKS